MARAPSFSRVPDSDAAPYPLERRRFYILAVNSMLALMQCLNWFTFSSVDVARASARLARDVANRCRRDAE